MSFFVYKPEDPENIKEIADTPEMHKSAQEKGYRYTQRMTHPEKGERWVDQDLWEEAVMHKGWKSAGKPKFRDEHSKAQSALGGFAQGATLGFSDEIVAGIDAATSDRTYDDALAIQRGIQEQQKQDNPEFHTAGDIAGGIATSFIPGLNVAKGAKATSVIAKNALASGIDAFGRSEGGLQQRAMDGASGVAVGGAFTGGLLTAGKGINAAKTGIQKMLPGNTQSSPIVNKAVAKLGSIVPGGANADEIEELLSNPTLRRKAAKTDRLEEAAGIRDSLQDASNEISDAVRNRFGALEGASLAANVDEIDDVGRFIELKDSISTNFLQPVKQQPKLFKANVKQFLNQVDSILTHGGPDEFNTPTFGKTISELGDPTLAKSRALTARRVLDHNIRGLDFKNYARHEQDVLQGMRDTIDDSLKSHFSGQELRKTADDLYKSYSSKPKAFFQGLRDKADDRVHDYDLRKIGQNLRNKTERGARFDESLGASQKWLAENQEQIGSLPRVQQALSDLENLRNTGRMQGLISAIESSGGPSSQAIRHLITLSGVGVTSGLSLLALPVTDPAAWTKIVDAAANIGDWKLARNLQEGAQAILPYALRAGALEASQSHQDNSVRKYERIMTAAAQRGPQYQAMVQSLMENNDPEFRRWLSERIDEQFQQGQLPVPVVGPN